MMIFSVIGFLQKLVPEITHEKNQRRLQKNIIDVIAKECSNCGNLK